MSAFPTNPARAPGEAISRAVFAHVAAAARLKGASDPEAVASTRWPTDGAAQALVRAAVSPGAAADHPGLIGTSTRDYLAALPQSAGARLVAEAMFVQLQTNGSVIVPYDNGAVTAGLPWVGELEPIAIMSGATGGLEVGPVKKLAIALAVSRSLMRQPGAEGLLRRMLAARAGRALDSAMFADVAANDDRVAGLLNGVSPAVPVEFSAKAVIGALAEALATGGGSGQMVLVADPATHASLVLEYPELPWPLVASPALPFGRVIAVDPTGLVFAAGAEVDILVSNTAVVHMSDEPDPIVDSGTADPVRELWQTDGLSMRLIVDCAWAAAPGRVAYVDAAV